MVAIPGWAAPILPAPQTLAHCAVNSSVLDGLTSCTLGTFDTAFASLTLFPFVSLVAQAAAPAAPGIHGAAASALATYSFQVIGGSPGDVVPILIATTLTTTGTEPTLGIGFAALTVTTGAVGTTTLAAVCTDGTCGTTASSFSGTLRTRARSGDLGDELFLQVQASVVGNSLRSESASASADPFVFVDPGFPGASRYSIVVSPAVGNALGDHYLCYRAALAKGQPKFVATTKSLKDQLGGPQTFDVKKIVTICNPAAIDPDGSGSMPNEPALHPLVHQEGYQIRALKRAPKFITSRHKTVDRFATRMLIITNPDSLLDVTAKVLGSGGTSALASSEGVDRFKCYKVALAKGEPKFAPPASPMLADEFFAGGQRFDLKRVTKLCTPIDKNGETPGAEAHAGHLVCYKAKLPKGASKFVNPTVSTNSTNFGAQVLRAVAPSELCVPALKDP